MSDPARQPHEEPRDAAEAAGASPAPAAGAPPPRRGFKPLSTAFMMVGFALLAFVVGLVVFNSVVMPRLIHSGGEVEVPDLSTLTLEQAEKALVPLGLELSRAGERFDPSVPRGFVLSQDPAPGTFIRGARRVSVVVSLGEEFSSVPALYGETQRSAEALLKSSGLRLGVMTRAPSDDVGEGLVAGSDPGPETVLPRDGVVNLLISTGAGEESFVMPDVMGREIGGVRRQLEAFGFRVITPAGGGSRGTVVSQAPPAGSRITRQAVVVLQASGRVIP